MRVFSNALLCSALTVSAIARAQKPAAASPAVPASQANATTPLDRWINQPTRIELSVEQRTQYDSLRAKYVRESAKVNSDPQPGGAAGDMARVMGMRNMSDRYRRLVRALLTAKQQPVFDENVRADTIAP
jgi:hypothetical protein